MSDREHVDVAVIAIDIEGSSRHEGVEQERLYRYLQDLFKSACKEVGLQVDPGDQADRGDGDNIVIRSSFALDRLIADLPREFAGTLDQFNRSRSENARLRVRMAVHHGPVWGQAGRWDGHVIVDTRRILDSQLTRTLLAEHRGAAMVLCISQAVFDRTVRERMRNLDPATWAPLELDQAEKGSGIRAWARLLGQGAPEATTPPVAAPPPPAAQSASGGGNRMVSNSSGIFTQGDSSPAIGTVYGNVGGGGG